MEGGSWAGVYFGGMLTSDACGGFVRVVVLAAALLTVLLTLLTGIPDTDDSADFHALLLGGTLGMMLMASANHLLMVFIAVEMASLPGYALAGFLKGKKTGSEAALKYVVYGAGASGVMLYGITLLAGTFGTRYLPDMAAGDRARADSICPCWPGSALILVGLGFKLAAVPFHFWCPDVFEGAAAEVAGFLSVASKAGGDRPHGRLLLTLHALGRRRWAIPGSLGVAVGGDRVRSRSRSAISRRSGRTNLKRLLAYSTIAHAGYMLLAVARHHAQRAPRACSTTSRRTSLMNLGAFAVVALVRNATGSRRHSTRFRGLVRRQPLLAVTMTMFLLSLLGLAAAGRVRGEVPGLRGGLRCGEGRDRQRRPRASARCSTCCWPSAR